MIFFSSPLSVTRTFDTNLPFKLSLHKIVDAEGNSSQFEGRHLQASLMICDTDLVNDSRADVVYEGSPIIL